MLRIVPSQAERLLIEILEARGPGKIYSPRSTAPKVWAIVALSQDLFRSVDVSRCFRDFAITSSVGGKIGQIFGKMLAADA